MGQDLVPDEVSVLLGTGPSLAYARGDKLGGSRGPGRIAKFGFWGMNAPETEPADFDRQVAELLSRMTQDLGVWHALATEYDVDLFCGWFMDHYNEGLQASVDTLQALAERRISLGVDLYGPTDLDES